LIGHLEYFSRIPSFTKSMGVDKLWSILEPSSKPIRIETLQGSRLAVDASIWLHQFQKAMRDADGEAVQGAHLVGFLRRICKLLFHGIKPVFVYDGGVPELKKRTIAKRQALREKSKETVEKTAQSLLENQLKLHVLTGETITRPKRVGGDVDEYLLPSEKK
jgi:DNA excision repair protein ERCC-5